MQRRMLSVIAATGLGIALTLTASAPPSVAAPSSVAAEPDPCQVFDFDTAEVTPVAVTGSDRPSSRSRLTVTGTKPATNVWMRLLPVKHVAQPDFWGILVSGCTSGPGQAVPTPYTVTYEFDWTMGSCGIEVIGATRQQRFDLAGCRPVPFAGTSWFLDPAGLGVPVPADAAITARFSGTTVSGSTSCNPYRATYTTDADGAFRVGAISVGRRYCGTAAMAVEAAFLARLAAATRVQATRTALRLWADGQIVLHFIPPGP